MERLNIYRTHSDIVMPSFATKDSACFDLAFQHHGKTEYTGYNHQNAKFTRPLHNGTKIYINAGDRILIPTGLIFDIPEGYSVRIHPRSGLSFKQGLVLANLEAVIDSDYIQETFVLLTNNSANGIMIESGDRIAQAEMVKKESYALWEIKNPPTQKTDRVGGLGSTGVGVFDVKDIKFTDTVVKKGRGRPKKIK